MKCHCGNGKEAMLLIENPALTYPAERCMCSICTESRCEDCKELWGPYLARTLPHKVPKRREAVLATREKL